ncbi:hypothetical protein FN976_11080 [Caenimonas sedimenti]|uniref:Uncharacterized protein n=1 Tax=Caenimonas sedimenti TaxID=2596921 RepID=A0A562ZSV1_9BURK|nr:hypothetical protein [Caenimonas sedimenti]TWO71451.1 hypothetical protein FN976_11080 [Caenimonas sedimenti]
MKLAQLFILTFAVLAAGCTTKPSDAEIQQALVAHLPEKHKTVLQVDQVQSESSGMGDDLVVKFKARVSTREPLYMPADMAQAAKAAGADLEAVARLEEALKTLTAVAKEPLQADIERATSRPQFFLVATPAQTGMDWYGSFKAKKVVDKWITSQFQEDVPLKLDGLPSATLPAGAVLPQAAEQWFAETRRAQLALLARLDDAKRIAQKDAELAAAQAATEQARAAADHERQQKEQLANTMERQARRLPISVNARQSAIGKGQVMVLETRQPITVRLEVRRGAQSFTRDLQLAPGRKIEIGHLEGWAFASGDQVQISNPGFDPARFTVR